MRSELRAFEEGQKDQQTYFRMNWGGVAGDRSER